LCLALSCKKEEPVKPPEPVEQKQAETAPDPSAALEKAAEKWVDQEFQPSTLTRDQQLAELKWFREAAKPYRG
jgi:glycerol transport system substrate-binding protein